MKTIETKRFIVDCGETIELLPANDEAAAATEMLVQSDDLQVKRVVVPEGHELPLQRSLGDTTVHCLNGRVEFMVDDETHDLDAGRLVYLGAKTPFSVRAVDDSVLLLTTALPNDCANRPLDLVQEASEESFPASDPPAHG